MDCASGGFLDIGAAAADLALPIGDARGLPGHFYSAAALDAERDRLFAHTWTPIAVASRIPNAGNQMAVDLAGWPLLLVRARDGAINVFFNICRHRGNRLVTGCHTAPVIRCAWHSWSYALDGGLIATPHIGGYGRATDPAVEKSMVALKPVRSGVWLDYVFVDLSGTLPPLADHLAPVTALLANHDYGGWVHDGGWTHGYPGNWKIAIEGAMEDYHIPWGHPQIVEAAGWRSSRTWGEPGVYSVTTAAEGAPTVSQDIGIGLPEFTAAYANADPRATTGAVINIFPTAVIGTATDHVMLGLMLPDGADRTNVTFDYFFHPDAMQPEFDMLRAQRRAEWEEVAPQDDAYVAGVQANVAIRDRAGVATRFAPAWEGAVQIFQQSVVRALAE